MCSFCGGVASFSPTEECRVCRTCAKRVADLAKAGEPREIWHAARDADEESTEIAERVASQVGGEESDAPYNLALAFRQMAMYADALRAASHAFASAPNDAKATAVLRMLLTPPLLREDGLGALRERLSRLAKN